MRKKKNFFIALGYIFIVASRIKMSSKIQPFSDILTIRLSHERPIATIWASSQLRSKRSQPSTTSL